ncbi:hypothetical protein BU14_0135s0023 [Porphyra umbilicalis]|uniref:Uncharacterized protein n=1 Tax=Porphyra umbilicalis TaxID=2786 RepID=A0A1X6PA13_PORUM|nr:hypothetical protein BU14_0135s0023 [Porphyra umbilicalis]|eukprot:OSX77749.1 hypothetical protein BU14_0135s0023 [Porphyra umbilicalis]
MPTRCGCWPTRARRSCPFRRLPTGRCRPPSTPSTLAAVTRNDTRPRWRPRRACAPTWPPFAAPAASCGPSVGASCTWAARSTPPSTAHAAGSPPRRAATAPTAHPTPAARRTRRPHRPPAWPAWCPSTRP